MSTAINVIKPSVIVLFGITGDLAKRKILPALYHLFKGGHVHRQTYIIGTSRQVVDPAQIVHNLRQTLPEVDESVLELFASQLSMVQLDPNTADDYERLHEQLTNLCNTAGGELARFFYLSLPPQAYMGVIEHLGTSGLANGAGLLIEKPFGYDTASAEQLIQTTGQYFHEEQVFRIDHYLAKETAQNILVVRSQNPLFADIWNNQHISKVSITAAEAIGIEGRANFYDEIGALRDVLQSHLLQLLAVTLMDVPIEATADSIHNGKQAVLDAIEIMSPDEVTKRVVRGQYDGYRTEVHNDASSTETFVSAQLRSNAPQWQGTEIKLTTGKALKMKRTSITVDFGHEGRNRLQFRIQPDEGITLKLQTKQPGLATETSEAALALDYASSFSSEPLEAYERVLIDAMRGDRTLFATDQEVLAAWRIVQPILDVWQQQADDLQSYAQGSDGPPC